MGKFADLMVFLKANKRLWLAPAIIIFALLLLLVITKNISVIRSLKNIVPPGLNYFPN